MYQEFKTLDLIAVESIWYADSIDEGVAYTVAPELNTNLVIKLHPNHSEVVYSGVVTHQQTYPYMPDVQYFGIRFRAGVQLGDMASPYELQNVSVCLSDQRTIACLGEHLHGQNTLDAQLKLLYQTACQMINTDTDLPTPIRDALHYIDRKCGATTIRELSQQTMMSQRHLERLFKIYMGVSPKQVCNIVRIRRVLDGLWQSSHHRSLTDLALQFGYADQAHLANNFRHLIGMSITDYLATL